MEGNLPFAWLTQDLTESGVLGDAAAGTKEKGSRILESLSDGWVKVIKDVYKFQQPGSSATSTVQDVTDVTEVRNREEDRCGNAVTTIVAAIKNVLTVLAVAIKIKNTVLEA